VVFVLRLKSRRSTKRGHLNWPRAHLVPSRHMARKASRKRRSAQRS